MRAEAAPPPSPALCRLARGLVCFHACTGPELLALWPKAVVAPGGSRGCPSSRYTPALAAATPAACHYPSVPMRSVVNRPALQDGGLVPAASDDSLPKTRGSQPALPGSSGSSKRARVGELRVVCAGETSRPAGMRRAALSRQPRIESARHSLGERRGHRGCCVASCSFRGWLRRAPLGEPLQQPPHFFPRVGDRLWGWG